MASEGEDSGTGEHFLLQFCQTRIWVHLRVRTHKRMTRLGSEPRVFGFSNFLQDIALLSRYSYGSKPRSMI